MAAITFPVNGASQPDSECASKGTIRGDSARHKLDNGNLAGSLLANGELLEIF